MVETSGVWCWWDGGARATFMQHAARYMQSSGSGRQRAYVGRQHERCKTLTARSRVDVDTGKCEQADYFREILGSRGPRRRCHERRHSVRRGEVDISASVEKGEHQFRVPVDGCPQEWKVATRVPLVQTLRKLLGGEVVLRGHADQPAHCRVVTLSGSSVELIQVLRRSCRCTMCKDEEEDAREAHARDDHRHTSDST